MRTSTFTKATVAILVGAAIAPAAPAAAQNGADTQDRAGRDQPVLRRDGSAAVPFVPNVGPVVSTTDSDGFDWGDAAMGAAGAVGLMLLASTAVVLHRRRQSRLRPSVAS